MCYSLRNETLLLELREELVRENSGNVIFMDFWASWCAPCRGEMPKAKEIRKAFAGSKVSFIYISENTIIKYIEDQKKV